LFHHVVGGTYAIFRRPNTIIGVQTRSMVALILSLPNWAVIVALIGLVAAMVYIFAYRSDSD
jgi:hypothetical protein